MLLCRGGDVCLGENEVARARAKNGYKEIAHAGKKGSDVFFSAVFGESLEHQKCAESCFFGTKTGSLYKKLSRNFKFSSFFRCLYKKLFGNFKRAEIFASFFFGAKFFDFLALWVVWIVRLGCVGCVGFSAGLFGLIRF